ncbi:AMP-binding protein [Janthinobacterium sp. 17J80-10]|uniref:AMP-binding protein n=1 Tax=Janthinobacterium sp. 17J80-10 TaxID=2497863 RepID=UPI00100588D1|nr:AMP-binding protein [Janthinobacterium sp. 17J80-10]QAU33255.1 hypothetical protein EKL02_03120 [Janthinobacterium sp. 17J80-10]
MEMNVQEKQSIGDVPAAGFTVYEAFRATCARWPNRAFLAMSPLAEREYFPEGYEITYTEALAEVGQRIVALQSAGYGLGHRIGVLAENRPQHFILQLAFNALGISIVPLNPDLRAPELAFILAHSDLDLVISIDARLPGLAELAHACSRQPPVVALASLAYPPARTPRREGALGSATEAGLLYTSGTTGKPKGCILSNEYYEFLGNYYARAGGVAELREGLERVFNPLPVFHQNAGIFTLMGVIMSGACFVMTDRFHLNSWWREVAESRATVVHYLGVMTALLLKLPASPDERRHAIRFGIGAGIEPELHALAEARFGFPLVELWGSTETGGGFLANAEPRQIHDKAVGRPGNRAGHDFEVRLVDQNGADVVAGAPGELLVRRRGSDPRRGMFSGYLKDEAATAAAWRGGWYHTGDVLRQDDSGMLYFVDRIKNIIRRSGENIAAAEIEAVLLTHQDVVEAAVFAVPDALRDEEVMACIVPSQARAGDAAFGEELFEWCFSRLAYYKAPGWLLFVDTLPKTSTQKVQKANIFGGKEDPRQRAGVLDFCSRKKKQRASA